MAIGLFFGSVNGAQNGILAGFEAYRDNALFSGVMSSFILVVKIILTSLYALDGAVLSMILEPIFLFSGLYFVSRGILKKNDVKIIFRSSLKDFDLIINYGLPSILVGLIVFPTNWHVLSLMTKIEGGYYEVGFYNIANQWFNLLVFIPYILASTFLPVFTTLLRENNSRAVNKIIINAILILILIFLPVSIFFLFFGNSISQLIYGSDYYGSGPVIALSIFTLIPQGISIVLSNLTSASGKMWFTFWVNLLWALVLLMLVYSFSQPNSMNLTLAKLIAFSVNSVVMIIFYMRWKKRILN
jgi:O-antigen/teichoic acid export membrane protein